MACLVWIVCNEAVQVSTRAWADTAKTFATDDDLLASIRAAGSAPNVDCANLKYARAGAWGIHYVSTGYSISGVRGYVHVPDHVANAELTGHSSVGDIALETNSGGEFAQFGWYIGSGIHGLPDTSTPRWFIGQDYDNSPSGETLLDGGPASGGWHYLSIVRNENGSDAGNYHRYFGYADNVLKRESPFRSDVGLRPLVTGEVSFLCTQMALMSYDPTPYMPFSTLQLKQTSTGSWSTWQEHALRKNFSSGTSDHDKSCFVEERINGESATDHAYGPQC